MADNLNVQIVGDSSKLRADLKLAQVEIQRLNREMTAAARLAAQTGDRTQLNKLSREADAAARSMAALNRQLAAANTTVANTEPWSAATRAVHALKEELIVLGRQALSGFGLKELGELVGKTSEEILRLRRMSQATGFDPLAIKAVNEALERTGAEAGSGDRALIKLSEAYSKLRQDARAAGDSVGEGVNVIRGGSRELAEAAKEAQRAQELMTGVNVLRGGQPAEHTIKDARGALAALGVDWRNFSNDMEGRSKFLQAIIDGFARLGKQGKTDLMNLAAFELFGVKNAKELGAAIKALGTEVGGLERKMEELRHEGRDPNEEAQQRALAYRDALKDISDAWDALGFTLLTNVGPGLREVFKGITNDINAINQASKDLSALWDIYVGPTLQNAWDAFVSDLKEFTTFDWSGLWKGLVDSFNSAIDAIKNTWQTFKDSVGQVTGGADAGDPSIPAMPRAAGGLVSDPFRGAARFAQGGSVDASTTGTVRYMNPWEAFRYLLMRLQVAEGAGDFDFAKQLRDLLNQLKSYFRFAAGGAVTGSGSGDTVPAWLTPGEYVARRASVDYYGVNLFRALNARAIPRDLFSSMGFAMGGLVGPQMSFADGGVVGSDRAPVHLHLGGQQFSLAGAPSVVDALVIEANRQQLRSAGVKPSWFAGRPGGH